MEQKQLPITCPLCGRKNDFPLDGLFEGSIFVCPVCNVKLTLHGHMWQEIEADIQRLKSRGPESGALAPDPQQEE